MDRSKETIFLAVMLIAGRNSFLKLRYYTGGSIGPQVDKTGKDTPAKCTLAGKRLPFSASWAIQIRRQGLLGNLASSVRNLSGKYPPPQGRRRFYRNPEQPVPAVCIIH